MSQRRSLGTFDRAQALTTDYYPYNLVTAVRLVGGVNQDRLRRGLEAMTKRHAALRSRIVKRPRPAFELTDATTIPLEIVAREDNDTWIDVVEGELITGFDLSTAPLGRCFLVTSPGTLESEIVLTFPHLLVDGTAVTQLVRELLESLVRTSIEGESESESLLPASADELFPAAWQRPNRLFASLGFLARQMRNEISFRLRTRGRHARPPEGTFRCRILPRVFSDQETTFVTQAARSHRVTITAALEAAMLLAVVRHRYEAGRLPHNYMAFPLLRRYLDPPVADDTVGCFITVLRLMTDVAPDDDVWTLAATINRDLNTSMRRGERFLAPIWSRFSMRMVLSQRSYRMGTIACSYTGPTPLTGSLETLEVQELHAVVSNFPIGPEYSAHARLFRGRLWLDILYLDSDMSDEQAEQIADTMRVLLLKEADVRGRPEGAA